MKCASDSSSAPLLLARSGPGPWHELVEAIVRPEINQASEAIGEPGLGIDITQFGGLDERSENGPILGTVIMTREQSILTRQSLRAHGTLDDVGVEFDAAIVEEAGEAVPVPQAVEMILAVSDPPESRVS